MIGRTLAFTLALLAVIAPAAAADSFSASNTTDANNALAAAASQPGVNVLTLAPGTYGSLSVPAVQGDHVSIVGAGATTSVAAVNTTSGEVDLAQMAVRNVNAGGPLVVQSITSDGHISATALTMTDSFVGGAASPLVRLTTGPSMLRRATLSGSDGTTALEVAGTGPAAVVGVDNSLIRGRVTAVDTVLTLQQVTQYSDAPSLTPGTAATVKVTNSILARAPVPSAGLTCSYSGLPAGGQGACSSAANSNTTNPANPADLFVSVATGNFHLVANAPAIDHGSGAAVDAATESTTDLDGRPRLVAYDNCRVAFRDQGAYEAPTVAAHPVVGISGPASAKLGETSAFAATGPDAGSSELSWTFGDGGTASGATANHTWLNTGNVGVTLAGTAANGCIGFATALVAVAPVPPPPPPPDRVPPKITHVKISPTKLKAGPSKKLKLTLKTSEPAVVIATVMRRDPGVFRGGKCVARKKGRKGPGCLRDHALTRAGFQLGTGKFTVPLALGKLSAARYVLQLESADLAKNAGPTKRLGFTVSNPTKPKPKKKS